MAGVTRYKSGQGYHRAVQPLAAGAPYRVARQFISKLDDNFYFEIMRELARFYHIV